MHFDSLEFIQYFISLQGVAGCQAMNGCLTCLAYEYPTVKFCKIKASDAKMTHKFVSNFDIVINTK